MQSSAFISDKAIVQTRAIGSHATIHEFAIIRDDVRIGDHVVIHPHVVIESGVTIGNHVEIFPGAYIGKAPKGAGALTRKPLYEKKIVIGDHSSIGTHAVIYYDVTIGKDTLIGDGASLREQVTIGDYSIIGRYVTANYNVAIGNHVKIMDHTWLAGNMVIGNDVFISGCVGTANDNSMGKASYKEEQVVGPRIEDGAAIGLGALLLPNIEIGCGAIVGAGAIVTTDIPNHTLWYGNPARCKGYICHCGEERDVNLPCKKCNLDLS